MATEQVVGDKEDECKRLIAINNLRFKNIQISRRLRVRGFIESLIDCALSFRLTRRSLEASFHGSNLVSIRQ